ncbi:hypothetical protein HMPREF9553_00147 [Escherichia coli MS 200-1]|nr:hypothetical protein HMPREF9553_00147 [Escherichia coli MS 200-1]
MRQRAAVLPGVLAEVVMAAPAAIISTATMIPLMSRAVFSQAGVILISLWGITLSSMVR